MKSISIQSRRQFIIDALQQCRQKTLDLLSEIDEPIFTRQAHPDFSPIGWHLGHIVFTEAYWILEYLRSQPSLYPQYRRLFAADGLPKAERQQLPAIETLYDYSVTIRNQVLAYLQTAPLDTEERLWRWLIQHESQHSETMTFLLQLHRQHQSNYQALDLSLSFSDLSSPNLDKNTTSPTPDLGDMVKIPAGAFIMGSNEIEAQDNERPAHKLHLDTYWLDRYPVTCTQYQQFITDGGYQNRRYWSKEGWRWLQINPVSQPLYWSNAPEWSDHPVYGVSYYEAEAYANYVGKRLPTEAEWAKAAQGTDSNVWHSQPLKPCNHDRIIGHTTPVHTYPESQSNYGCYDMLGNVWEWTSSWFSGYQGFTSYPYAGYSQVYFDDRHRVLRGGSWATRPWALRTSFRNWYHPSVRQILAGFRCAAD